MRRVLLALGGAFILGLVAFGAIQLIPYGRDHANPPVVAEPAWDSPQTRAYAVTACFDCHSNQTVWPWYSTIAPFSWVIQHDVDEGREALNYSEWGPGHEGGESAEAYAEGNMPLSVYLVAHPEANFPEVDRTAFLNGLRATFGGGD